MLGGYIWLMTRIRKRTIAAFIITLARNSTWTKAFDLNNEG